MKGTIIFTLYFLQTGKKRKVERAGPNLKRNTWEPLELTKLLLVLEEPLSPSELYPFCLL